MRERRLAASGDAGHGDEERQARPPRERGGEVDVAPGLALGVLAGPQEQDLRPQQGAVGGEEREQAVVPGVAARR